MSRFWSSTDSEVFHAGFCPQRGGGHCIEMEKRQAYIYWGVHTVARQSNRCWTDTELCDWRRERNIRAEEERSSSESFSCTEPRRAQTRGGKGRNSVTEKGKGSDGESICGGVE